jgi:hypothetical protein
MTVWRIFHVLGHPTVRQWPDLDHMHHWHDNTDNIRLRRDSYPAQSQLSQVVLEAMMRNAPSWLSGTACQVTYGKSAKEQVKTCLSVYRNKSIYEWLYWGTSQSMCNSGHHAFELCTLFVSRSCTRMPQIIVRNVYLSNSHVLSCLEHEMCEYVLSMRCVNMSWAWDVWICLEHEMCEYNHAGSVSSNERAMADHCLSLK